MDDVIRVIDIIHEAQPGYYAVAAMTNTAKIKIPKRKWLFFKSFEEMEIDYRLYPVMFWASVYLVKNTEQGEARGSSLVVPMVRVADGIEAAPGIDGYVGVLTPDDDSVESNAYIRNAINVWKEQQKQVSHANKQSMN